MKKTAISLLLALSLVLGLVLVAAPAAQAAEHTNHCACAGKAVGVGEHKTCTDITDWTPITQKFLDDLYANKTENYDLWLPEGNYYLAENVKLPNDANLSPDKDAEIVLCLNGFTYESQGSTNTSGGKLINVRSDSGECSLTITDCSKDNTGTMQAKLTQQIAGEVIVQNNADSLITIYAGNFLGDREFQNNKAGTVIYQNQRGSIVIYGGTFVGGKTTSVGANVMALDNFTVYGGVFKPGVENTNSKAANVLCDGKYGNTINIYGGVFEAGTDVKGGLNGEPVTCGIYVRNYDDANGATLNIYKVDAETIVFEATGSPKSFLVDWSKLDASVEKTVVEVFKNVNPDTGAETVNTLYKLTKKAPVEPDPTPNPGTGDSVSFVVLGLGMVMGIVGMVALLPKKQTI